jgi:molybdopterin-guanine dinucleotide biosynthesis protein B
MKVLGLAGWSGSGKTTLLVSLIPALKARGLTVSTVKHAHHAFDVDRPGKDSWRHRQAGAREVMVASARRWALMHEHEDGPEPGLAALLAQMSRVDLVLVEGFRAEPHDKLEVWRQANGKPLLAPADPHVVGLAADVPRDALPADLRVPVMHLDDVAAIAAFVVGHCRLGPRFHDAAQ